MTFARRVFRFAGVWGLVLLLPMYGLEGRIGRDTPPPITHPEFFYGFVGVGAAWQVVFLVIGSDPARFRPLMLPSVLEKATFVLAVLALYAAGRVPSMTLAVAVPDLILGGLFLAAWWKTAPADAPLA